MKKSIRILAVAMVAVLLCLCMASCGKKLSGEYEATIAGTGQKMEFSGKNVTVTYVLLGQELGSIEGTYSIEDDEITFDFVDEEEVEDEDLKEFLADLDGTLSFEEGDDYIKIAGVKYEKAD